MKIVSWNICNLPYTNKTRNVIIENITEINADIICLQEVFCQKTKNEIKNSFNNKYYIQCDNKTYILTLDSGLMILSKYPIKYFKFMKFKKCCGEDCLANKGFLHTEIEINNEKIDIINTHIQNSKSYFNIFTNPKNLIINQLTQILTYINLILKNNINKVILCGDFNCNLKEILKKIDSKLYFSGFTQNETCEDKILDHILIITKEKNLMKYNNTNIINYDFSSDHKLIYRFLDLVN